MKIIENIVRPNNKKWKFRLLKIITIIFFLIASPTFALADENRLSIEVIPPDKFDKIMGSNVWSFYLDGPIDPDSPRRLKQKINESHASGIDFYLNSPGGSLISGIEIGRIIRKFGGSTYIGRHSSEKETDMFGECYSSCSLAYLGGFYRYKDSKSIYGVHRFYKDGTTPKDLELGQIMSAKITNFISEMGVSSGLFDLMVEAGPNEMRSLSENELVDLNIVNNGRLPATWTIEALPGVMYLKGDQVSVYGHGKLIFSCLREGIILHAIYEAGNNAEDILKNSNYFAFMSDGETYDLNSPIKFINNSGWLNALHHFPKDFIEKAVSAKELGYAMQFTKGAPMFRGFNVQLRELKDRERVKNFLDSCKSK